jgi:hypothetical protein
MDAIKRSSDTVIPPGASSSHSMPTTPTNILALPVVQAVIDTGNNEDWVDTILYLVDDGSGDPTGMPQLDLRGIDFLMEIRRASGDNEVIIEASTLDGTMAVGAPPNFGFLIIYVPLDDVMQYKEAGSYIGDIIAFDGAFQRRCCTIDLNIIEGVTR